jgi:hypothetical protein
VASTQPSAAALIGVNQVLSADWPRLRALEYRWDDTCYSDRYSPCRGALRAEIGQLGKLVTDLSATPANGQLDAAKARFIAALRATRTAKQLAYDDLARHRIAHFDAHKSSPMVCIGPLNRLLQPLDSGQTSGSPPPVGPPYLAFAFDRC